MVIYVCPVSNDQFFTLLMEKNLDIPYFEVKYCYKLSNKDTCMLFNIPKQLKLMEIEGHTGWAISNYPWTSKLPGQSTLF